jgi:hypothetical protein
VWEDTSRIRGAIESDLSSARLLLLPNHGDRRRRAVPILTDLRLYGFTRQRPPANLAELQTYPAQTRWRSSVRTRSSSARGGISMSGGGEAKRVLVKRWKSRLLLSEDGSSGSSSCRDGQAARSAVIGEIAPEDLHES